MALTALLVDTRTHWLESSRSWFLGLSQPLYTLVSAPQQALDEFKDFFSTRNQLRHENARLYTENLVLHAKVQKLNALTIENIRLRELLNSIRSEEHNALIAEVVSVSQDPYRHYVLVNKGRQDGVYISQAVVDAEGLLGQVTEVAEKISKVMLLSDVRHGVPVQVDRSGVRLYVEGMGDFNRLQVPFVTTTTDLVEGDVLTSSGLGGVFPANYPVARVVSVQHESGQAFSVVTAEPFAQLAKARHVLLLFEQQAEYDKE